MNDSDGSEEDDPWGVRKQRWNFVQSTMILYQAFEMMDLMKLTQRNKPLQKFYQNFARN